MYDGHNDSTKGDPRELAQRIGGLRAIRFELRWTFIRSAGLPFRSALVPKRFQRRRRTVERSTPLEIDASFYRSQVVAHWRQTKEWQTYADLAEGVTRKEDSQ